MRCSNSPSRVPRNTCVRVHESRDHESTRGVQDLGRREASAEFLLRAHGDDPIAVAGHGLALRVVHTPEASAAEGIAAPRGRELADPDDEEGRARGRRIQRELGVMVAAQS